ncbi:hypothetical protein L596_011866 [Steinernema carpocapsae]|uniref:7TM GPCR serpentine receptor class x (Srx) domain-containing protein n=1 Tax=Steinernema carpocapsae TaxID=34508 RepID=A0A4U5NW67_STECR|nr:hypothetical protein L596_011866 [Steinernema carpocapsae]
MTKINLRLVVGGVSVLNIILGIALIAVTCSVFDFVIMNKLYYAMPSKTILIDPKWSLRSIMCILFNLAISSWTLYRLLDNFSLGYEQLGKWQKLRQNVLSIVHLLGLIAAAGASLYLCLQFSSVAERVGMFAAESKPQSFQDASSWYFLRLRAIIVLMGSSMTLNLISFCLQNNCDDLQRREKFSKDIGYPNTQC